MFATHIQAQQNYNKKTVKVTLTKIAFRQTIMSSGQNALRNLWGTTDKDGEPGEASKQAIARASLDQPICCCLFSPSIYLSVKAFLTAAPCGSLGMSPGFPGSAFGSALMIVVFRQGRVRMSHSQVPEPNSSLAGFGYRAIQRHTHRRIPVALDQLAISTTAQIAMLFSGPALQHSVYGTVEGHRTRVCLLQQVSSVS